MSTISDILRQGVDSLVQWLEHWISIPTGTLSLNTNKQTSGPGSNPIRDVGFFFKLCIISYLRIFIFVRWGLGRDGPFESYSHKNDIFVIINDYYLEMGVCYVPLLHHSFIRDYLPWLEGRVGRSHDA